MKRLFDIIISFITLFVFLPLIVVIALLIKITIGSPVIFKQLRPGLYGKPFYVYKFRTMTDEKDSFGNLLEDSKRLSPLGKLIRKLSLDELPQLLNVLKGDMSFVGPRPLLMEYLPLYNERQSQRHDMRPGITGWAQVNGRNTISWEEKFEYDIWYIKNWSFWLDMKILYMTVVKVIKSEGVNQAGQATTKKFTGTSNSSEKEGEECKKL